MARPVPFHFGRDFKAAEEPAPQVKPTIDLEQHKRLLADAEETGFARGLAAGRDTTLQSQTARIADTSERLCNEVAQILSEMDARQQQYEREAIELAVTLARKLGGAAVLRFPLADIEAAAVECFQETRTAPHVVVRIAPDMVEEVESRLTTIAAEKGFAGRLIVLGEPEIQPGDARFEWADGGIIRDGAALDTAIANAVAHYLRTTPAAEDPS
ncbi:flagellar assembly protein FliH [Agaricicola taiwanensis]|uniref:Flagellar assembly protein FliH n=1 Tax=Agaricicola taiwanensis TaxID=591372 RepID=A0A8J2VZK8_9RHOB|nr:FliH/SctL family protein [Agaricicola taiwanensis]GGE39705.1 flagellar assembly protein FliH [Agaricicola taiwanensis]